MRPLLLLLLTAALPLCAQEPQQPPPETQTSADTPIDEQTPAASDENPKLRLGHPLDPADVATLTGRSSQQDRRRYSEPAVYLNVPGEYGNLWLRDAPTLPLFFGGTGRLHGRRLFMHGPNARGPHIFFPVFNGLFFVGPR